MKTGKSLVILLLPAATVSALALPADYNSRQEENIATAATVPPAHYTQEKEYGLGAPLPEVVYDIAGTARNKMMIDFKKGFPEDKARFLVDSVAESYKAGASRESKAGSEWGRYSIVWHIESGLDRNSVEKHIERISGVLNAWPSFAVSFPNPDTLEGSVSALYLDGR